MASHPSTKSQLLLLLLLPAEFFPLFSSSCVEVMISLCHIYVSANMISSFYIQVSIVNFFPIIKYFVQYMLHNKTVHEVVLIHSSIQFTTTIWYFYFRLEHINYKSSCETVSRCNREEYTALLYTTYRYAFSFTVFLQQFGVNNFPSFESLDWFPVQGVLGVLCSILLLELYHVEFPGFHPFLFKLVLLLVTAAIPCHLIITQRKFSLHYQQCITCSEHRNIIKSKIKWPAI